jgi:alkylated DNA repair dioxygenase AlkB
MLFETLINLDLKDGNIIYHPLFFNKIDADEYFSRLINNIDWQQDTITVFGKTHLQPRLTVFFANNDKRYKYSNIMMQPNAFNRDLLNIKKAVESKLNVEFTSCLANLYRHGKDSNGWHADNEKELGPEPIIASVSFGAERIFQLKHRHDKGLRTKLVLQHGSLLIMKGQTQNYWLHQIPKTNKPTGKRINLTFRIIA